MMLGFILLLVVALGGGPVEARGPPFSLPVAITPQADSEVARAAPVVVASDHREYSEPPKLDVWFGPQLNVATKPAPGTRCTAWCVPCCSGGSITRPDLFPNLLAPLADWPSLSSRTSTLKAYLHLFDPSKDGSGSTDAELTALIAVLKQRDIGVGVEVGVTRWGAGRCNVSAALAYAAVEQKRVMRWVSLGGAISSVTSDHASVWNIRGETGPRCVPAVPMMTRIDVIAQGFIVSLGYWDIEFGGTNFTNVDPGHLNNISGWIPRLDDFTTAMLAAAKKHNPVGATQPLLDHYQIDFGMGGVEEDTLRYGTAEPAGINYGRVLGAEAVMRKHGLKSGIILNAFSSGGALDHGHHSCLVGCGGPPSQSAATRTINYTQGYLMQPQRLSEYAVLEQWQPFPNVTGPETTKYSSMWMAAQCAKAIKPDDALTPQPPPPPAKML